MSMTKFHPRSRRRWAGIVAGLFIASLVAVACGPDSIGRTPAEEGFQKVTPSDRVYAIEDLFAMGFKKSKQYDVEGLPGGIDAWSGFWGPDPYDRSDYEIRVYASHEDAVEYGTPLAEEVTGEEAELHKDNPTWKEGAKDRWRSSSVVGLTRGLQSGRLGPKYLDFAIFANLVILSEGEDSADSFERCEALVEALRAAGAE